MARDISSDTVGTRKSICRCGVGAAVVQAAIVACMFLTLVSPSSAESAKAKSKASSTNTKASTVAELKTVAAPPASVTGTDVTDPVICIKPADADASPTSAPDDKTGSSAKASSGDREESARESNSGFMKDKLKLSLGGKPGSAADQPQQCGVDEAGAPANESETATSK